MNNLSRFLTITKYTFVEIYKSRVLLSVLFLGIALILVCYVASEFTFGVPQRVALDFGLGLVSISGQAIAMFMGVSLLSRELENRTIYMVLSRPVPRSVFLLGRVSGLLLILFVNMIILWCLSLLIYFILGGAWSALLGYILLLSIIEASLVLMIVVFFSLITNSVRAIIFSLVFVIAGHTVTDPTIIPFVKNNYLLHIVLKGYAYIFPDFTKLNFKAYVLYEQFIPMKNVMLSIGYGIVYIGVLAILSITIFKRKELN